MIGQIFIVFALLQFVLSTYATSFVPNRRSISSLYETGNKAVEFTNWFKAQGGVISDSIEVHSFPGMGNGFLTKKPVKEGDLIITIPNHIIFNVKNMKEATNASGKGKNTLATLYEYYQHMTNDDAIIAWLLYEKSLGKASNFYEYISILPTYIPSLIHYTNEEVSELQNLPFESKILKYQDEINESFRFFKEVMKNIINLTNLDHPELVELFVKDGKSKLQSNYEKAAKKAKEIQSDIEENEEMEEENDKNQNKKLQMKLKEIEQLKKIFIPSSDEITLQKEDYLWALSVINSRGLRFQGELNLIPMADIFNYQSHSIEREAENGNFFLKYHQFSTVEAKGKDSSSNKGGNKNNKEDKGDEVVMKIFADRDITTAGHQLFEDYGDNTNEIYFQYHGFIPFSWKSNDKQQKLVENGNPFHCVNIYYEDFYHRYIASSSSSSSSSSSLENKLTISSSQRRLLDLMRFPIPTPSDSFTKGKQDFEEFEKKNAYFFDHFNLCFSAKKASTMMTRQYLVYLSILAFNEEEADTCLTYLEEAQELAGKTKSRLDWGKLARDCQFESAYFTYRQNVDEAVARQSSIRALAATKSSSNTFEERVMKMIQQYFSATIEKAQLDSFEEDLKQLAELEALLSSSNDDETAVSADERTHLYHVETALKYRIINKQLYQEIATMFNIGGAAADNKRSLSSSDVSESVEVTATGEVSSQSAPTEEEIDSDRAQLEEAIANFNIWFNSHLSGKSDGKSGYSAIAAHHFHGTPFRIGTKVIVKSLPKETLYLSVPTEITMDAKKSFEFPGISQLVNSLYQKYGRNDEFHELLFFLLYEVFLQKEQSYFYPYLRLLPTYESMEENLPLFWSKEVIRKRLLPSNLIIEINDYRSRIDKRFSFLVKIPEIMNFFGNKIFTSQNYYWATAILDSRAIWWNNTRHLVPMLDFINCMDKGRVHSTSLDKSQKYAITYAGDDYKLGEQLFENYGQPNHIYYTYHGFILPENNFDCLHYHFYFETEEFNQLKADGLDNVLQHAFGIQNEGNVYTVCLSPTIQSRLWLFLSLKFKQYTLKKNSDRLLDFNEISKPSKLSVLYLLKNLKDKLKLYSVRDAESVGHDVSYQFLLSEQEILRKTVVELTALYEKTFAEREDKENVQVMEILNDNAHIPATATKAAVTAAKDNDDEEEEEEVAAAKPTTTAASKKNKQTEKKKKSSSAVFDEEEDEF